VKPDIAEIVRGVIASNKEIDAATVGLDVELGALGITSLDVITIVYDLEEALDIQVPNEAIESLRTVGDLIEGLERLLTARDA
jgi:acyl carrier protein